VKKAPNFVEVSPKMEPYYVDKNFCPKKLLVKIWEFKDKNLPNSTACLNKFWAIF
jgi:hypothetical protein